MADQVTSRRSQIAKKVRRLEKRTFRDRDGIFIVEGLRSVREAFARKKGVICVLYDERMTGTARDLLRIYPDHIQEYFISCELMEHLSSTVNNQGIMALVEQLDIPLEEMSERSISLVLVMASIRDPGNMGALIRVADAAGADCAIVCSGSVDLYNAKVVRAAVGSHFHVPLIRGVLLDDAAGVLKKDGVRILAMDPSGRIPYHECRLTEPIGLVIGNEAHGMTGDELALADAVINIPMKGGAESLNAATAAAVVLFEANRQRDMLE